MEFFRNVYATGIAVPLMLCANTVFAQDAAHGVGACGQPIALNSQPVTLNAKPTEISGGLVELRRNEPRYVELTIAEQMPITLATMTSERDMTLILFDAKGEVVGADDDSGADSNAQLIAMLEPGVYCAQIAAYGSLDASSLVVPFSVSAAPPAAACIVNATETLDLTHDSDEIITTGVLAGPVNFGLRLAAGARVSIAARSPMFDTVLTLQDQYGREVASDDDGGGDTNSLLEVGGSNQQSDYCVTLSSLDDERGVYSLSFSPEVARPMTPENQQQFEAEQDAAANAAAAANEVEDATGNAEAATQ